MDDSTSRLLNRLDLTEQLASPRHGEAMDDMDIDVVEEVSASAFNSVMRRKKHNRDSGPQSFGTSNAATFDTMHQTRQKLLAQQIESALENANASDAHGDVEKHRDISWKCRDGRGKRGGGVSSSSQPKRDVCRKNDGPGRMAQNGFIAPCSSAKRRTPVRVDDKCIIDLDDEETCPSFTNTSKKDWMKGVDSQSMSQPEARQAYGGSPLSFSPLVNINSYKKKGKMILEDKYLGGGRDINNEFSSHRLCSVPEEVPIIADVDNSFRTSESRACTKYHITGQPAVFPPEETAYASKREETSCQSQSKHDITEDDRQHRFMRGNRDHSSGHNNGGSSSSMLHSSEASYISSRQISETRLTRNDFQHHDEMIDQCMELNEVQLPESNWASEQSSTSFSQVESDEMLARRLQEQFYNEVSGSAPSEETDATIAWSLQQEDAQLAASDERSGQTDHRDASKAHLYAYYQQLPHRNCSARSSNRAQLRTSHRRRDNYRSQIDLETRMLAELRNFTGMDVGTRRNFLEVLEATFDHSDNVLADDVLEDDVNERDYEMLLALDDDNHQPAGASENQISRLPQSVIQNATVEEACAVCLENPSLGDVMRHLPCLHKFHKECIDPWLRKKTWCPVCKLKIS